MKHYITLQVNSRIHVLTDTDRSRQEQINVIPNPNYCNTGKALAGILRKNETLEDWINRKKMMSGELLTPNLLQDYGFVKVRYGVYSKDNILLYKNSKENSFRVKKGNKLVRYIRYENELNEIINQ